MKKSESFNSSPITLRLGFLRSALLSLRAKELFSVFEEHVAFNVESKVEMEDEAFLHGVEFAERDPSNFGVIVVFVELIVDIFYGYNECNEYDSMKINE